MYFGNQFPKPMTVADAQFTNISSGSITLKTYNTNMEDIRTQVSFENAQFSEVLAPSRPFISLSSKAMMYVTNGTFSDI